MVYLGYFRIACRLASLLAYGLSLIIVQHVQPIAAKVYDDLCSSQGVTFGEGYSVRYLGITMVVFAVQIFFARSNALIVANLIVALTTILAPFRFYTQREIPHMNASQRRGYTKIERQDLTVSTSGSLSQPSFPTSCY
jgi:hypothetical protein